MTKDMILNFTKLFFNSISGFAVSYLNIKNVIECYTDLISTIIGIGVGIATFVYLCYQIKKIRKHLRKK